MGKLESKSPKASTPPAEAPIPTTNLGAFDPIDTEQFTTESRDESNFNAGTIIFNTTTNSLQVFDGVGFVNITDPFGIITVNNDKLRFSDFMTAELGTISVTIS